MSVEQTMTVAESTPVYQTRGNAIATLMKEIETMSESTAAEVLDFAMYLKTSRYIFPKQPYKIATKDAYGLFKELKGMDTTIERDEEDRI